MQSGQVSVWVPIVVGVLGLLGVIVGQLVNAWRDVRQSNRDRQLSELKQHNDDVHHWREVKRKAYAEFAAKIGSLSDQVILVVVGSDARLDDSLAVLLKELNAVRLASEEILFICSPPLEAFMLEDLKGLYRQVSEFYSSVDFGSKMVSMTKSAGMTFQQRKEEFDKITISFDGIRDSFRQIARQELRLSSGTFATPS